MAAFLLAILSGSAKDAPAVARTIQELLTDIQTRADGKRFDCTGVLTLNYLSRNPDGNITLQDGDVTTIVRFMTDERTPALRFGDRIRVTGFVSTNVPVKTVNAVVRKTCAVGTTLTVLAHDQAPRPLRVTPDEIRRGTFGGRLVRIEGIATDAFADEIDANYTLITLDCGGETVYAGIRRRYRPSELQQFIGARLAVVGVSGGHSGQRQIIQTFLYLYDLDAIRVLDAPRNIDRTEASDIRELLFSKDTRHTTPTRKFAIGNVIAAWDGNKILIRTDDGDLIRGELAEPDSPSFGSRIRLVGFPETDLYNIILFRARWQPEPGEPCSADIARDISIHDIRKTVDDVPRYDFQLHGHAVRLTGRVRGLPVPHGDGRLYLECDGQMVTVDVCAAPEAIRNIDIDCRIHVSGTCIMETEKMSLNRVLPRVSGFRIAVRSPSDIVLLSRPSWWTPMRLLILIGALLIALGGVFIWNRSLANVADRRSHELLKEQLARVESELKVGERTRLSVELHDTLSQNLLGASMEINTVEQLITEKEALRHLKVASKTLRASRDELRNCLWDLRSQALEEPDMNTAIRRTLEPYASDVDLQVRFNVPREIFTDNTAHALMRIIRELVMNAIRHGHAKTVKIAGCREDGHLLFSVRDDGCGFNPAAAPGIGQGHFGLQGVRERLRLLKGSVSIDSSPGSGTHVSARFQLPADKSEKI